MSFRLKLVWILYSAFAFSDLVLGQAAKETYTLDPLRIAATRELPAFDTSSDVLNVKGIQANQFGHHLPSGNDISELMSQYAGYSAFRRTASSSAHPTTQGIRLRHLGANATSRALILLDGVPQNDPFGGWVYWHRYHEDMLDDININASGGGEAWGNFGAGGVISLQSRRANSPHFQATAQAGSRGTYSLSFAATQNATDNVMIDLGAKIYRTDGFHTIEESQRGSLDERANSESSALRGRVRWNAKNDWSFSLAFDNFAEERSNGTSLAQNDTDAFDVSFSAQKDLTSDGSHLNFSAYSQQREFANVFTAVDSERGSERPALDQFDVPADAAGFSISYLMTMKSNGFLLIGADHRSSDGEVNELFRNLGSGFTRSRIAGGKQAFTGLFTTWRNELNDSNRISTSIRLDRVEQSNGLREEFNLESNTIIRSDAFPSEDDTEMSFSLAWYHDLNDRTQIRLKGLSGFRTPTLNELYRPFRVRNDITEANVELNSEGFNGIELSWSANPADDQSYFVSVFHYEIEDIIANAFLSDESGFDPLCGFVPDGGSCSQRRNLDESRISGLEARWRLKLNERISTGLSYLFSDSAIQSAETSLDINGRNLPHVPEHRLNMDFSWRALEKLSVWGNISFASEEYEDTRNIRRIDSSTTFQAGIRFALSDEHFIGARVDNLFDEKVNTGVATNGLRTIGAPRGVWLTWNYVK